MAQDLTGAGAPPPSSEKEKSVPWAWIIAGLFVAVFAAMFGLKAIEGTFTYYLQADEYVVQKEAWEGRNLKIAGYVEEESYKKEGHRSHYFNVVYGDYSFPVHYSGLVPDTFKEGVEVVVEGRATEEEVFEAKTVMAKCASKYEVGDLPPLEQRIQESSYY